ncbi:vesicle-associated protein 1-3-like [Impatiens glandulifera]|uniref:vesicle-associated protein 1-3-like n=1 Tax=Impatiens glandulifera TaxID=253017 RepID=UPI001FB0ED89|nr:vesicle-associated protein 1-3-like [Impatiens glandulifera]
MSAACNHLTVQPSELSFPFKLKKQSSCSLMLANNTDQHVAFKVKTTNPKKYCVRPNSGFLLPGDSTCNVTVTMQAQKKAPLDLQCKDKFLIQSVVVSKRIADKDDITAENFDKAAGNLVREFKLRVVYVHANQPLSVVEGSKEEEEEEEEEEGSSSSRAAVVVALKEKEEYAIQRQELDPEIDRNNGGGGGGSFSMMFVIFI